MDRRTFLVTLAGVAAAPQLLEQLRPLDHLVAARQLIDAQPYPQVWILAPGQEKLIAELEERGCIIQPWFPDRRPIAGRRLIVPVWTDRGIEELVYHRAPIAHPLAHVAHLKRARA